jgi:hypothetical protein
MVVRKAAKAKVDPVVPGAPSSPPMPAPSDDSLRADLDGLTYVLDGPPTRSGRAALRVALTGAGDPPWRDAGDLLSAPGRQALARRVAQRFERAADLVEGHLIVLLDQVERAQGAHDVAAPVTLSPARKRAAEQLLASRTLLDRAARAFDALGYVGEGRTKRLVFLVGVSRLLAHPLSAVLLATSAAGKSAVLDTLARLLPHESVLYLSRLTARALYHASDLRHKVVIVDEQAGAEDADHALRVLQSAGHLKQLSAGTGRGEIVETHGPIAFLSGTTRTDLNPENLSRCLELALDESPEQTRRVLDAQRRAWTGEAAPKAHVEVWQDAQRLLEPLQVVIPFAARLTFPAKATKARRDNQKLLALIAAHALLFQRQRERDEQGRLLATAADYAAIHGLVRPLVEDVIPDLSPRAAPVYRHLADQDGEPVTRHEVVAHLGTTYQTARRALDDLVALELVEEIAGKPLRFRLLDAGGLDDGERLVDPAELDDGA